MQILQSLMLQANSNGFAPDSDLTRSSAELWGTVSVCILGILILLSWQLWCGGFGALRTTPVRRNRLRGFEPIVLLSVWLVAMLMINITVSMVFSGVGLVFQQSLIYLAIILLETGLIAVMVLIVRHAFARRLKGFGLNVRTVGRDAGYAAVYLLAVYPLILFGLWTVLVIGRLIRDDFNIEQHQSLIFLTENGGWLLRLLVVVFSVFIVPVFEEMLFRGFLQTTLRTFTRRPWVAIILTSAMFSLLHPMTHVPALFFLSCGLGYAYERSGSLFRPILLHIFFNGISVAATFLTVS